MPGRMEGDTVLAPVKTRRRSVVASPLDVRCGQEMAFGRTRQ